MALEVDIFDSTMVSLKNPSVEILEDDDSHVRIDADYCSVKAAGSFGVTLNLPSPVSPIEIWVDDHSGKYGSTSLRYLNGNTTTQVDVVLYLLPVPPGGGGTGPGGGGSQTAEQVGAFIYEQVIAETWTAKEAEAVRMLYNTVMSALSMPERPVDFLDRLTRWVDTLQRLGIWIGYDPGGNLVGAVGDSGGTGAGRYKTFVG